MHADRGRLLQRFALYINFHGIEHGGNSWQVALSDLEVAKKRVLLETCQSESRSLRETREEIKTFLAFQNKSNNAVLSWFIR